jgi:DNA-binding MarR family transcriptional regulator
MTAMISLGRRLRPRLPGDEVDFSAVPLLKTLQRHGPMRISALAGMLELDASTVSRQARHLESRGLIARTGDPDDGRASQVTVSEEGAACLERHTARRRELIGSILADWSAEDREQLRSLLTRFQDDLDKADWPTLCQHTSARTPQEAT